MWAPAPMKAYVAWVKTTPRTETSVAVTAVRRRRPEAVAAPPTAYGPNGLPAVDGTMSAPAPAKGYAPSTKRNLIVEMLAAAIVGPRPRHEVATAPILVDGVHGTTGATLEAALTKGYAPSIKQNPIVEISPAATAVHRHRLAVGPAPILVGGANGAIGVMSGPARTKGNVQSTNCNRKTRTSPVGIAAPRPRLVDGAVPRPVNGEHGGNGAMSAHAPTREYAVLVKMSPIVEISTAGIAAPRPRLVIGPAPILVDGVHGAIGTMWAAAMEPGSAKSVQRNRTVEMSAAGIAARRHRREVALVPLAADGVHGAIGAMSGLALTKEYVRSINYNRKTRTSTAGIAVPKPRLEGGAVLIPVNGEPGGNGAMWVLAPMKEYAALVALNPPVVTSAVAIAAYRPRIGAEAAPLAVNGVNGPHGAMWVAAAAKANVWLMRVRPTAKTSAVGIAARRHKRGAELVTTHAHGVHGVHGVMWVAAVAPENVPPVALIPTHRPVETAAHKLEAEPVLLVVAGVAGAAGAVVAVRVYVRPMLPRPRAKLAVIVGRGSAPELALAVVDGVIGVPGALATAIRSVAPSKFRTAGNVFSGTDSENVYQMVIGVGANVVSSNRPSI